MFNQQCLELLRPCWQWYARMKRMRQFPTQYWDRQCVEETIQPIILYKLLSSPWAKETNVQCASVAPKMSEEVCKWMQYCCTTLRPITEQKNFWQFLVKKFDQFQTLCSNTRQHATTCNSVCKWTQNLASKYFGSCWPKGLFTGLYRSINLTSFTALTKFKSLFLFQIFIGGFLETVSLSYITIVVMLKVKLLNSDVMILLPCSLPLGFTLWHFIKSRSQWNTKTGKLEVIRFGISAVFGAAGVSFLCYKYEVNKKTLLKILLSLLYKV